MELSTRSSISRRLCPVEMLNDRAGQFNSDGPRLFNMRRRDEPLRLHVSANRRLYVQPAIDRRQPFFSAFLTREHASAISAARLSPRAKRPSTSHEETSA